MSEKPEALKVADAMLLQIEENMSLRRENERLRQRYYMEQEIFRGGMYQLRSLLTEARSYLSECHPIAESLFPRIDAALRQEDKK
jgi:hypothetical protein